MSNFVYVNSTNSILDIGSASLPPNGSLQFTSPQPALDALSGGLLNRYVGGVLNNTSSYSPITVVTDTSNNLLGLVGPNGTAGYVDAGFFGASPNASAAVNVASIQAALNKGGNVTMLQPGVYQIPYALLIGSNTRFILGKNTTIQLAAATNNNNLGTVTLSNVGTLVTATTTNAIGLTVGSSHIMAVGGVQFSQDFFNGLWQCTITGTNSFNYTLPVTQSNQSATPISGGYIWASGPYMEPGRVDNVLRNVNWASPQFYLLNPQVVSSISIGSIALQFSVIGTHNWNVGDYILIKNDTSRAFSGAWKVFAVASNTVTIEYFSTSVGVPLLNGTIPVYLTAGQATINGNNNFVNTQTIVFNQTVGNITAGVVYYVIATGLTRTTFQISASLNGAAIVPSVLGYAIAQPIVTTNGTTTISMQNSFIGLQQVQFTGVGAGALPTGLTANTNYYVLASSLSTTSFQVSATPNGTAISVGAGTANVYCILSASKCDNNIEIEGGIFDGNGITSDASWMGHILCFNKTANLYVHQTKLVGGLKYSIAFCNSWRPTFRDINLQTTSDGIHSMGPNWGVLVDSITGSTNDDFVVHTSNDPEAAYPFNVFPRNAGAVINFPQGTATLGTVGQGTVPLGGGELIGFTVRNVRPQFQNARYLIDGANSALPFNNITGVLFDGVYPSYFNQSSGSSPTPQFCIASGDAASTTAIINDVTIKNWYLGGTQGGASIITFEDVNIPNYGAIVQINKLEIDNFVSEVPLKTFGAATTTFFEQVWESYQIGTLTVRNSKFDIDNTLGNWALLLPTNSNAAGQYVNKVNIDNCIFSQVTSGTGVISAYWAGGGTGTRVKEVNLTNCYFDSVAATTATYLIPVQGSNNNPATQFNIYNNTFNKVQNVVSSTGSPLNLRIANNTLNASWFNCFVYGSGVNAHNIWWSNNILASGLLCVDPGVTGYVIKQGDTTLKLDLTKVSRNSPGATIVHNGATTAGTIVANNLCICDATNAANSWKQISNTNLVY